MAIKEAALRYSIAEARDALAAIVREVERKGRADVTRRGRTVAVLLSAGEYQKLGAQRAPDFWQAYQAFRRRSQLTAADADAFQQTLRRLRDRSRGRATRW